MILVLSREKELWNSLDDNSNLVKIELLCLLEFGFALNMQGENTTQSYSPAYNSAYSSYLF